MTRPDVFGCPHCDRSVRRGVRVCPGCGYVIGVRILRSTVNGIGVTLRVRTAVPPDRAAELDAEE